MFTNPNHRSDIVRKIENHMAAKGIKRITLQEAIGVKHQAFKRRMDLEIPFDTEELFAIAKVLKTAPSEIMPDDLNEIAA